MILICSHPKVIEDFKESCFREMQLSETTLKIIKNIMLLKNII